MHRSLTAAALAFLLIPIGATAQRSGMPASTPKRHPLPVVGTTRERFAAVDAVTLGDRIFVVERTVSDGWLHVYDASDVANPFELRDAMAPVVGRPIAIAGDGQRVLVASVTADTTRIRLTLFDVSRADRSRWSGAASLPVAVPRGGVEQMYVEGARAIVKTDNGPVLDVNLEQLERDFAAATRGDESSAAARAMLRALTMPGTAVGEAAILPSTVDTAYRDGKAEHWSSWGFALNGQIRPRLRKSGALLEVHGQWDLDIVEAATRRIVYTTHIDGKNVNSIIAPDSADVLVNDLVRVGDVAGHELAVFNATILGPTHRDKGREGGVVLDVSDPRAPTVAAIQRRLVQDTAYLRYGWHPNVRDAVFAGRTIVLVEYDSTWIMHFDDRARLTATDSTGRFAGRLVRGPDGTVLELSVEPSWRDTRRIARADSSAPAIRIRTSTPRVAVREAAAAIPVDERGRTTAAQRVRFEIVSPDAITDPSRLNVSAAGSVTIPAIRRGALLTATIPAGTALGSGALTLALSVGDASGKWVALAAPPTTIQQGTTRSFVTLDDPFTNGTLVIADSGSSASDAAFIDPRLRARLHRDTLATIFAVPAADGSAPRIVRRDRGRAEVGSARTTAVASYPAAGTTASLAALRHFGAGPELGLVLCLRDALGKRVQEQYMPFSSQDQPGYAPCGDVAVLREWIRAHGGAIVEGPAAAVILSARELAPPHSASEVSGRRRWSTARAEIVSDSVLTWSYGEAISFEDSGAAESLPEGDRPSGLSSAERSAITRVLADAALLTIQQFVATDSTDSTVAVIRARFVPLLLPGDSITHGVLTMTEDGSLVYGDWSEGRWVPRWEGWSYSPRAAPQLIDLDGDGIDDLVFTSFGRDAKSNIVSQEVWAYDRAGRELTRQSSSFGWQWGAFPISTEVTDGEYCDVDCGGFVVGRPGPDGTRPLRTSDGDWILRGGHYVFRPIPPPPPKPKPAAKKQRASRARKKPAP